MFEIVQQDLDLLETELLSIIRSPERKVTEIATHLVEAGGKRLRPALYFMCARSGCNDLNSMLPLAAAIELIHMATLVHDDVIDNASTRRGRTTANVLWGNHASVLTGDYLFAKAFSILANKVSHEMLKVLTDVICSMCEGELNQNNNTFNPAQTESDYQMRIAQKTADFIAASCELGGMSAQLAGEDIEALREYGYCLGMAFQITDDLLDITASSEQIGKPVGNDLRQGIITLPVIYALGTSPRSAELREIVQKANMPEESIQRGLEIIHSTEAVKYCFDRVDDYLNRARNRLPASFSTQRIAAFHAVTDFVGLRNY
jgi:heptaprenyl diphosphate synthase